MKNKNFLVVVDMQNDFISGSLGSEAAQSIVPRCAEHIKRRIKDGYQIIATMDTHNEDYLSTAEGKKLPVEHCIRNTWGWQLETRIRDVLGDCVKVLKPTFGSLELPRVILDMNNGELPEHIELIGLCTDICVVSNALLLKAHFPETPIYVFDDCCEGVTPELHVEALHIMESCQIDFPE